MACNWKNCIAPHQHVYLERSCAILRNHSIIQCTYTSSSHTVLPQFALLFIWRMHAPVEWIRQHRFQWDCTYWTPLFNQKSYLPARRPVFPFAFRPDNGSPSQPNARAPVRLCHQHTAISSPWGFTAQSDLWKYCRVLGNVTTASGANSKRSMH